MYLQNIKYAYHKILHYCMLIIPLNGQSNSIIFSNINVNSNILPHHLTNENFRNVKRTHFVARKIQ